MRPGTAPILIHMLGTALLVAVSLSIVWWRGGLFTSTILVLVSGGIAAIVAWTLAYQQAHEGARVIAKIETIARDRRVIDPGDKGKRGTGAAQQQSEDAIDARGARGARDARGEGVERGVMAPVLDAVNGVARSYGEAMGEAVSRQRDLELKLRLSDRDQHQAETVLEAIADGVIVTDALDEVALVNGSAARFLGFDRNEALGRSIDDVIGDARLIHLIRSVRESGDAASQRRIEHEIAIDINAIARNLAGGDAKHPQTHGGATPGVYDVRLTCLTSTRLGLDETAGVVMILRDITREKSLSETMSDFVAGVSHELRTPITSVKAYMEMLLDGEAEDEATRHEFYNIIQGETNRLSRLIDNILGISRIESGVTQARREQVGLAHLVSSTLDVVRPQARARNIDLFLVDPNEPHVRESGGGVSDLTATDDALHPDTSVRVFADRDMIRQALLNLIGNAIKYTPDGGSVTVCVDQIAGDGIGTDSSINATDIDDGNHVDQGGHADYADHTGYADYADYGTVDPISNRVGHGVAVVTVTDTGVGIPEEDLPRLFDKFYRVEANTRMAKGTGLGLTLVKHLIETVHGGELSVSSTPGKGSSFRFTLPLAESPRHASAASALASDTGLNPDSDSHPDFDPAPVDPEEDCAA